MLIIFNIMLEIFNLYLNFLILVNYKYTILFNKAMIIIFNKIGILIVVLSILIYSVFNQLGLKSNQVFFLVNGFSLLILDILARKVIIKKYFPKWKSKGGTLFFIPIYIIGLICILAGIYYLFNP